MGSVTDILIVNEDFMEIAACRALTPEQLAVQTTMLIGMVFALLALPFLLHMRKETGK